LSFNKYYQDELSFLREMGKEFAHAHPEVAHLLAGGESDPDVERLLEGFAFLTGRIRQKLDDEFPEITHALMGLFMPHYLHPIPSISLVEFIPGKGMIREPFRVSRGTELASVPVDGTSCCFRTCFDVDLHPFRIESVAFQTPVGGHPELRLRFAAEPGFSMARSGIDRLRFFLSGEAADNLYLWLFRKLEKIYIKPKSDGKLGNRLILKPDSVRAVGFSREEALFPYSKTSFEGYRLLQEYFSFPEKFRFVELTGLECFAGQPDGSQFEISFSFSPTSSATLSVTKENVRLFCTPVVNLVKTESEPILIDHERTEYRIRPADSNANHFEIYSVDRARGWIRGTAEEREYLPFYSFRSGRTAPGATPIFYNQRLRSAVTGEGTDIYVSFVKADQELALPPTETVVFELTCTNRILSDKLRVGDIHVATESSPGFCQFRNITRVSHGLRPPLEGDLSWRLLSHLALNSVSLSSVEAFKGILGLYNFQSLQDRQAGRANQLRIDGIVEIDSSSDDLLFEGVPVRGIKTVLGLKESNFNSEGDMFLFASILNEFLALYVSLNSFSRLVVKGVEEGETYEWPIRIGRRIIL
jgi:type VI secretion system protein ImpG